MLTTEGFWSRLYWVRPSASTSSGHVTSTTSLTTSLTLASSSPLSASTRSSSSQMTPNSTANGTSSNTGGSSKGTAIGVGVSVGVGVALLLVGGFFLWRRLHRKRKEKYSRPQSTTEYHERGSRNQTSGTLWAPSPPTVFEAPMSETRSPVEAPGRQMDPQELQETSPDKSGWGTDMGRT